MKAEGGQSVFETREEHDSSELAGSAGGYGFQARVPLKELAPGLYVLRIEATARVGDRPTVSQRNGVPRLTGAGGTAMNVLVAAIVLVARMQSGPQAGIETIVRDNMSNVEDAKQAVARTPAEWAALWRLHAGDQAGAEDRLHQKNRGRRVSRLPAIGRLRGGNERHASRPARR